MNKGRLNMIWGVMGIVAALVLLLLVLIAAVWRSEQDILLQTDLQPPEAADAALVLGNAVNRRGRPNPCLRSRVEAGVRLYRAGKVPRLLMSGGTDPDGSNQAEAMRAMALNLGVPEAHIIIEPRSENTYQNMVFSRPLLENAASVIVVSDAFHLPRSRWLATRHLPQQSVQVFAAQDCGDSAAAMWRKRVREALAWLKSGVFDR